MSTCDNSLSVIAPPNVLSQNIINKKIIKSFILDLDQANTMWI